MDATSPQVVIDGRYRVLSLLGKGASAAVYLAEQPPIGRRVAVKVLHAQAAGTDEQGERILREAMVIASLKHPNIVTVHDYGVLEHRPYVVMEFVRGPTLSKVLAGEQALEPDLAVPLFEQIADALACAHRKGVVHRDIKPANILLERRTGQPDLVKVADFGVATTASSELTQAGTLIGTPAYMSPEQARGETVDQRADLYSLGVLMFRTLVGRKPFTPDDPLAMALCHLNTPVPTFAEVDPMIEVPPALESVVRRCLAKDPDQRYPSADDLLEDLRAFRVGTLAAEPTGGFTLEGEATVTPQPAPIRTVGRPSLAVGGALVSGLAAVGGIVWLATLMHEGHDAVPEPVKDGIEVVAETPAELAPAPEPGLPPASEWVAWGERPTRWRGSIQRRAFALDLDPGTDGGPLGAELTVHLGEGLDHHTLQGAVTAAGDDELALYLTDADERMLLTGVISADGAAGTLEVDGGAPLSWVAGALKAEAATPAKARASSVARPAGVSVTVTGDASRVFLVGDAGRVRVPGRVAPGEYGVVALFAGSEPVEAGTVVVSEAVTLTCSGFAARCKAMPTGD